MSRKTTSSWKVACEPPGKHKSNVPRAVWVQSEQRASSNPLKKGPDSQWRRSPSIICYNTSELCFGGRLDNLHRSKSRQTGGEPGNLFWVFTVKSERRIWCLNSSFLKQCPQRRQTVFLQPHSTWKKYVLKNIAPNQLPQL